MTEFRLPIVLVRADIEGGVATLPKIALWLTALVTLAAGLFLCNPVQAETDGSDIYVDVKLDGEAVIVHVDCPVHASAIQAWEVLTDYDHMPRFLSHLESSRGEVRDATRMRVYQKGAARSGFLYFAFENVRDVELTPFRHIRSRFVSGDWTASEFETELTQGSTDLHIINRGRYLPGRFVPPIVGPLAIAAETRRQFVEIRSEILRRKDSPNRPIVTEPRQ